MKTAISIPDCLFETAERFAKQMGLSRSELYAVALQEYLQAHQRDQIAEQLDAVFWQRRTSAERAREFREWVSQLPKNSVSLPDEAFSRDIIYAE